MRVLEQITTVTMFNADSSIFDKWVLPKGIDRETLIENVLFETECFNVIYTRPNTLKELIGVWSKKRIPIWEKLYNTLNYEYNPIENYDRQEWRKWDASDNRTKTENEVRDLANTLQESQDFKTTNLETRDLKNSNNEIRDLSTTEDVTRDLKGTDNEVRDLAGSLDRKDDINGTNNEVRDLATTDSSTVHFTDNTKSQDKHSGTDTLTHFVNAFNTNEMKGSTRDEQTFGHTIDTTNNLTHDGTENKNGTNTGTDNFTTSSNEILKDTTSESGTIDRDKTDTGTIKTVGSNSGTDNFSGTDTGTIDNKGSNTGSINKNGTDSGTVEHSGNENGDSHHEEWSRMHGNIGVTTTQKMIQEERDISEFDIIQYIIDDYKKRFCVCVY